MKYLDYCVSVKSIDIKICHVITDIATQWKLQSCFFRKKKKKNANHYQNEAWSNTSVLYDNRFLHFWLNTGDWKLVSGIFMIYLK